MRVDFVYFEDWTAMYVNGKLAYQNHTINGYTAMQIIQEHQAELGSSEIERGIIVSLERHVPTDEMEQQVTDTGYAPDLFSGCTTEKF